MLEGELLNIRIYKINIVQNLRMLNVNSNDRQMYRK